MSGVMGGNVGRLGVVADSKPVVCEDVPSEEVRRSLHEQLQRHWRREERHSGDPRHSRARATLDGTGEGPKSACVGVGVGVGIGLQKGVIDPVDSVCWGVPSSVTPIM